MNGPMAVYSLCWQLYGGVEEAEKGGYKDNYEDINHEKTKAISLYNLNLTRSLKKLMSYNCL